MKIEVDKIDLISMVMGMEPGYDLFEVPNIKKCGSYCGGFVEKWSWDRDELRDLTEKELYEMYLILKKDHLKYDEYL